MTMRFLFSSAKSGYLAATMSIHCSNVDWSAEPVRVYEKIVPSGHSETSFGVGFRVEGSGAVVLKMSYKQDHKKKGHAEVLVSLPRMNEQSTQISHTTAGVYRTQQHVSTKKQPTCGGKIPPSDAGTSPRS
jgi:hypothetical protein